MLPTQPRLRTRRPSPTTVEYTVSTSPPLTLALRLLLLTTFLLRLLIGVSILLLLYSKYLLSGFAPPSSTTSRAQPYAPRPPPPPTPPIEHILYMQHFTRSAPIGLGFARLATSIPLTFLLPASAILLYAIFIRPYTTESLLVLRGLGIQTSTSSATYFSTASTRFIPTEKIQDILVNEAFRGFEVRYYLVILVEGEEEVVVVFPKLLPKRNTVETVWRGARRCLFEPEAVGKDGKG